MQHHTFVFLFGNHPDLAFAELSAVLARFAAMRGDFSFSAKQLTRRGNIGVLNTEHEFPAGELMQLLGGTIKIARLLGGFGEERVLAYLSEVADTGSKFNFGFSLYALDHKKRTTDWKFLQGMGLRIKKEFRAHGHSARFVSSKEPILSSVIVEKERLLKNGAEIILLREGEKMEYGVTLAVQPFEAFSKRDYGRPQRDDASGMLPPKLARMMVNVSAPEMESVIYDPFCGSGTVLQEALLMGFENVLGSDKSEKAAQDTRANLEWLGFPGVKVFVADATKLTSYAELRDVRPNRIVFEGYLGPVTPKRSQVAHLQVEMQTLYTNFLKECRSLLAEDGMIVAGLPFWYYGKGASFLLPTERILTLAGYDLVDQFFYRRPQSTVGRHILVLKKQ